MDEGLTPEELAIEAPDFSKNETNSGTSPEPREHVQYDFDEMRARLATAGFDLKDLEEIGVEAARSQPDDMIKFMKDAFEERGYSYELYEHVANGVLEEARAEQQSREYSSDVQNNYVAYHDTQEQENANIFFDEDDILDLKNLYEIANALGEHTDVPADERLSAYDDFVRKYEEVLISVKVGTEENIRNELNRVLEIPENIFYDNGANLLQAVSDKVRELGDKAEELQTVEAFEKANNALEKFTSAYSGYDLFSSEDVENMSGYSADYLQQQIEILSYDSLNPYADSVELETDETLHPKANDPAPENYNSPKDLFDVPTPSGFRYSP